MRKIYVAASFGEKQRAKDMMKRLRADGYRISFDWTNHDDTGMEGAERDAYLAACAMDDFDGVKSADAVVLLAHPNGRGQYVEMGMAIAWGKPVFYVNLDDVLNVFFWLPEHKVIRVRHDLDVLKPLRRYFDSLSEGW